MDAAPSPDLAKIRRALPVLFELSAVVELRAFRGRREVASGFYDDHDALGVRPKRG